MSDPSPGQVLERMVTWVCGLQQYEPEVIFLNEEYESALLTASIMEPHEALQLTELKDNTIRCRLLGVPLRFTPKVKGAWVRFRGGKTSKTVPAPPPTTPLLHGR